MISLFAPFNFLEGYKAASQAESIHYALDMKVYEMTSYEFLQFLQLELEELNTSNPEHKVWSELTASQKEIILSKQMTGSSFIAGAWTKVLKSQSINIALSPSFTIFLKHHASRNQPILVLQFKTN